VARDFRSDQVSVRIAEHDGQIYLDLADEFFAQSKLARVDGE
jgi:hypothetical protein